LGTTARYCTQRKQARTQVCCRWSLPGTSSPFSSFIFIHYCERFTLYRKVPLACRRTQQQRRAGRGRFDVALTTNAPSCSQGPTHSSALPQRNSNTRKTRSMPPALSHTQGQRCPRRVLSITTGSVHIPGLVKPDPTRCMNTKRTPPSPKPPILF